MKIVSLITFSLWFSMMVVGQQPIQPSTTNPADVDSLPSDQVWILDKELTIGDQTIEWLHFDQVYAYLELQHEFKQILGVKWYGSDSIEFQLVCSSMLCDLAFSGIAKASHLEDDRKIDTDENGAYSINEFIFSTNESVTSIRIDSKNRSKARLIYTPSKEADECDPGNNLILKRINLKK